MHQFKPKLLLLNFCFLIFQVANAQDSESKTNRVIAFPTKLLSSIDNKAQKFSNKLDQHTEKYMARLVNQEKRLHKKLAKKDSLLALKLFGNIDSAYAQINNITQSSAIYIQHLDSLSTALLFLQASNQSIQSPQDPALLKTRESLDALQKKFNLSSQFRSQLMKRRKILQDNLLKMGMVKEFKQFRKQVYYYQAQIQEYKKMFEDPSKLERKLMEIVLRQPKFRDFFRQNSVLSKLFALPGRTGDATASLPGLQTRASMNQLIVDRFGSGPNVTRLLQDNMRSAQAQLGSLQNNLNRLSNGSIGNDKEKDIPEFKPNTQKTKSFLKRLEYGMNIHSQKARYVFPVTSNIGLSLGYKLNDHSSLGIGLAYKLGWGQGWDHIRISHQGIGLRTYLDWKLKGSLYISGAYEQNYQSLIQSIDQLRDYSAWQTSGLIGLSKKYKLSKKINGEMKILWDFLSYQQVPRTQAIVFRIGYKLK